MFWNLFRARQRSPASRPCRKLMLEVLEDRLTPSASSGTVPQGDPLTPNPPPLFQTLLSLSIDGAVLETQNLFYQYVVDIDEFPLASSFDASRAKAAAAGVNFDTVFSLLQFFGPLRTLDTAQSDLHANWSAAGPFAALAVQTGAQAALQAVQLPVQPHHPSSH